MQKDLHEANGALFIARDDMIVAWCRKTGRSFEPMTTEFMLERLKGRRGLFVDVGASTGWFSIPFALAGHEVTAFEPNARVRKRHIENAAINEIEHDLRAEALSRSVGTVTFWHNPKVSLTSGGSIEVATCSAPIAETVNTTSLDIALGFGEGAYRAPDLIKIDVEGHEIAVLDGAARTIASSRPALVVEANTTEHSRAIEEWLGRIGGYRVMVADERNLLCLPEGV